MLNKPLLSVDVDKVKAIKLLILDVDGVLTEGDVYVDGTGEILKRFNIQDGLGIELLAKSGVKIAVISGKCSEAVKFRLQSLSVSDVYLDVPNKIVCFEQLLDRYHLKPNQVAYMGDDLPDLPLIERAGLGITVANGHDIIKDCADVITQNRGGHGAVREVCDWILTAKGQLSKLVTAYRKVGSV